MKNIQVTNFVFRWWISTISRN